MPLVASETELAFRPNLELLFEFVGSANDPPDGPSRPGLLVRKVKGRLA